MKELYEEIREEETTGPKATVASYKILGWEPLTQPCLPGLEGWTHQENVTKQVGGLHYQLAIEPWDYITSNNIGYLEGNVIKYVSRYKSKNGREDLEKAIHYLEKLIEVNYGVAN